MSLGSFINGNLVVVSAAVAIGIATQDAVKSIISTLIGSSGLSIMIASYAAMHTNHPWARSFILMIGHVLQQLSTWFITLLVIYLLMTHVLQHNIAVVDSLEKRLIFQKGT